MDDKTLHTLEFDKVLARLAGLTAFAPSREMALALTPSSDHAEVVQRQRLTAEARRLLKNRPNLSIGGARDIRDVIERAALGGMLEPAELLDVRGTLGAVRTLRGNITRLSQIVPLLAEAAKRMSDLGQLITDLDRTISARGEVLDTASPMLSELRREVRIAHDRLTARMNDLLASAVARGVAQEAIVTLRDGRYVIPIKADFRGQFRGVVHDTSASGATAFVEPLAAVDLGNRWRELLIDEQREVERILRALSAQVGAAAGALRTNIECLAELDLAFAKARLGEALKAYDLPAEGEEQPWIVPAPAEMVLHKARHPLLTGDVVPVSLSVGGEYHVLLITGPNTGGKTVALKTGGLLTLMALSGLPVPADTGTRIPVYASVFADIGDEQSIEQSLSTFSGHMRTVINIIRSAGKSSLVLLDELGAGTDPTEGAALARAIVEELLGRGSTVIATTHHGELKLFAHSTQGVRNASVEFDPETFAPTYRLSIGLPGRSNAIAIARRLGMPQRITDRARQQIAPEERQLERLLGQLQRERDEAAAARQRAAKAEEEAGQLRTQLADRLREIEATREELVAQARIELEEEVEQTRQRLREAGRRLRVAAPPSRPPEPQPAAESQTATPEQAEANPVAEANEAVSAAEQQLRRLRRRPTSNRYEPGPGVEEIRPGDQIWLRGLSTPGEALTAPDDRGEVEAQLGALRTRVRSSQIVRVIRPHTPATSDVQVRVFQAPVASPGISLEVRGQRADEALPAVEEFINNGFRAGLPWLRIVHGKGTGALRRVVQEALIHNPLVASFETAAPNEGGEGVTIVHLAH